MLTPGLTCFMKSPALTSLIIKGIFQHVYTLIYHIYHQVELSSSSCVLLHSLLHVFL